MNNAIYQIETNKATLRGAMEAINSGKLEKWELKEFEAVRRECITNIRMWINIKKAVTSMV